MTDEDEQPRLTLDWTYNGRRLNAPTPPGEIVIEIKQELRLGWPHFPCRLVFCEAFDGEERIGQLVLTPERRRRTPHRRQEVKQLDSLFATYFDTSISRPIRPAK